MRNLRLAEKLGFSVALFGLLVVQPVNAQKEIKFDVGADIVSSYVWRGIKTADASIQPSLSLGYGDFSLSSWASTNITGGTNYKEVDFTAAYSKSGFTTALTDYWWDGEGSLRYFSSPNQGAGHMLEATLGYELQGSFPLSLSWNTFFAGNGNKKENGDNSFSTYVELGYPFKVGDIDLGISTGFTPWESVIYGTDGFKFTSIQLKAAKSIKITDSYSLPIFGSIITNPHQEDIHFVFGITIN